MNATAAELIAEVDVSPGSGDLGALFSHRIHQEGHDDLKVMELREAVDARSARLETARGTREPYWSAAMAKQRRSAPFIGAFLANETRR